MQGLLKVRDSFAGAGGWDIAVRHVLGVEAHGIEIMPEARATRAAAGLITTHTDVRNVIADEYAYDVDIASPPCQTFSLAGQGAGRQALDVVLWAIQRYAEGRPPSARRLTRMTGDERTALVLEPLRIALQGRSMFLAWEQVPPVLPVWEACAAVLRQHGYSVWTGNISSECYGVPQVRRRAILIARRDGRRALPPVQTHSSFYVRTPERLDAGLQSWTSMAEALGWGMTGRPYPTIASSRSTGGPDREKVGGKGARDSLYREMHEGRWVLHHGNMSNATVRGSNEPAGTIAFGNNVAKWGWKLRSNTQANAAVRPAGLPASALFFGAHKNNVSWVSETDDVAIRLSLPDAAVLQTFPYDWPFKGGATKQFMQVGNAIPPLMAAAVLRTFL